MEAGMPFAFSPDEHELPRAVRLEDGGLKHALDLRALKVMQLLRPHDDRAGRERLDSASLRFPRQFIERIRVGNDAIRTPLAKLFEIPRHSRFTHSEGTGHASAIESVIERIFGLFPAGGRPHGSPPQIPLPGSRSRPGPTVTPVPSTGPAIVALFVQIEFQGSSAGAAGRFLDESQGWGNRPHRFAMCANLIATDDGPVLEVGQRVDSLGIETQRGPRLAIIGTIVGRMHEERPERFQLAVLQLFER